MSSISIESSNKKASSGKVCNLDSLRMICTGATELFKRKDEASATASSTAATINMEYVNDLFVQTVFGFELDIISIQKLQSLSNIEYKIDELTKEAKAFLEKHEALVELIDNIINDVKDILCSIGKKYKIKIYLSKDMEVENWEEIVLIIGIEEKDFSKIIQLWDKIEEKVEDIIYRFERDGSKKIFDIKKRLCIEVDRLENV